MTVLWREGPDEPFAPASALALPLVSWPHLTLPRQIHQLVSLRKQKNSVLLLPNTGVSVSISDNILYSDIILAYRLAAAILCPSWPAKAQRTHAGASGTPPYARPPRRTDRADVPQLAVRVGIHGGSQNILLSSALRGRHRPLGVLTRWESEALMTPCIQAPLRPDSLPAPHSAHHDWPEFGSHFGRTTRCRATLRNPHRAPSSFESELSPPPVPRPFRAQAPVWSRRNMLSAITIAGMGQQVRLRRSALDILAKWRRGNGSRQPSGSCGARDTCRALCSQHCTEALVFWFAERVSASGRPKLDSNQDRLLPILQFQPNSARPRVRTAVSPTLAWKSRPAP